MLTLAAPRSCAVTSSTNAFNGVGCHHAPLLPRSNPHSAHGTTACHFPRFRSLEAFVRRPLASVFAAIRHRPDPIAPTAQLRATSRGFIPWRLSYADPCSVFAVIRHRLAPKPSQTQKDYIRAVKNLTIFLGRSPDTATAEDLRLFQLHLTENRVRPPSINFTVTALRFFFTVTLDRADAIKHLTFVAEPRKIPVVLSPEEVARFLEAAPGVKYKAAFSAAYGAGLRVSEVAALKVSDIDSERMLLRIEQGKGRKDRHAMLSPVLLELLRDWWRIARPKAWLFPGRDPLQPMSTRQLNRACHAAASMAEITKRVSPHTLRHSFATHLLEQNTDIRVIQVLLGHAKLDTTALYTRIATNTIRAVMSPLEHLNLKPKKDGPPA